LAANNRDTRDYRGVFVSRRSYIERLHEHIPQAVRLVLDEVHESVVGGSRGQERPDRPALAMNEHVQLSHA
jgi:hypothetical protein